MALVPKGRTLVLIELLVVLLVLILYVTARAEPVLASYYGEWYTGKPTASGELYDPKSYTAAHPYLPFGTRLLVSYNGQSVIVTVNDRIPSGSERTLDLSLAAAQYIGLTDVGEAVVDAEVLQTQPTPPA